MRVQKDVLQANTIGEMIGLVFEVHVAVGPILPSSSTSTSILNRGEDMTFKVKAWFKHQNDNEDQDEVAMLLEELSLEDTSKHVVLVDCEYDEFFDLSQSMITAYQDVATVARGLETYDPHSSLNSDGEGGGGGSGMVRPTSFYGHIFTGLDEDDSGLIC